VKFDSFDSQDGSEDLFECQKSPRQLFSRGSSEADLGNADITNLGVGGGGRGTEGQGEGGFYGGGRRDGWRNEGESLWLREESSSEEDPDVRRPNKKSKKK
jgi:hypothetical protein